MATRNAIHILKNTLFPSQSLPASAYLGEPLVNLGDGIMFFSGSTAGSPTWVPSDNNSNYFEIGSNLYDLKIRNQITQYNGLANLAGKFLSGSTSGFVLADISSIQGVDSYLTGATWNPNSLTLSSTEGKPNVNVTIDSFNNLNLYGTTNVNGNITVTGTSTFNGLTYYNNTATASNEVVNYGLLTAYTESNDTYVTGFTYNNANIITLSQNQGKPNLPIDISTLASITVNGDVTVTGTTTTGNLIVNNPSGTTAIIGQGGLVIGSGGSPISSGVGDLTIHGSLVVYGTGTTINTNELYIEDPTITLNYNPSGSSTSTSVGSGIIIQDGSGIVSTNTTLQIGQLYLDTNINSYAEYTSATGNSNRGLFTQLNDIIVRNTNNNSGAPNGKRLIAEDDILDGGYY